MCVSFWGCLKGEGERGSGIKRLIRNSVIAAWTAVVSILDWRYYKAAGMQLDAVIEVKKEVEHVE